MKHNGLVFLLYFLSTSIFALDIQGHRGARWSRPENTLPAFQFAIDAGADTLEMDTLVTKDNVVVVTHDPVLSRELCRRKPAAELKSDILIRSLTWAELQNFDCASRKNPKFPEQVALPDVGIPRLEDVLNLVKASKREVRLNIETKIEPEHPEYSPDPEDFVRRLDEVISKSGLKSRVTLQSFDPRTLQAAKKLKLGYVLSLLLEFRPHPPLDQAARDVGAKIISPDYHWITNEDVLRLHKAGIQILPWTVNERDDWARLIKWGVDGIITDNPKGLVEFVRSTQSQQIDTHRHKR